MPKQGRFSFLEAAEQVLRDAHGPLHADEICDRALREGLVVTRGRTPRATMASRLAVDVRERGHESRFRRVAPNTFCLANCEGPPIAQPRPPVAATVAKRKNSLWPLPGGAEQYAVTLREMLRHVRAENQAGRRVDYDRLADWLATRYSLKGESTPRSYAWLIVQLGAALQEHDGNLVLTSLGQRFADTGDGSILGRLLVERITGVADVFPTLYPNRSLDSAAFQRRWSETYGWTRTWQTYYRLNWLRSAGLVRRTDSGGYTLTAQGKTLAEELRLTDELPEERPVVRSGRELSTTDRQPPPLSLQAMIAEHRNAIRGDLRERLMQMSPTQFEHFAGELLEALGFSEVEVTRRASDGGVDGHGTMRVGIVTVRAAFQCKRWSMPVGRPEIQRFRGAITGKFDQGVFVATSSFSKPAQQDSIQLGAVPIILVDGDGIAEAMIQHGVGVIRRPLELLTVDEDFFEPTPTEDQS